MAAKKRGGGSVANLTVEILRSIRDEIRNTNTRLDKLGTDLNERLDATNERLESVDTRLGRVETRLESVDTRLERVEIRLESVDTRLESVETRLESHGKAIVKLIGQMESMSGRFDNFLTGAHRAEHEELRARVDRIEQRLDRTG